MTAVMNNSVPDLLVEIQFDGDPFCSFVNAVECDAPRNWWRLGETSGTAAADSGNTPVITGNTYTGGFTLNQGGATAPPAFADEAGGTSTVGYDTNPSVLFNGTSGFVSIRTDGNVDTNFVSDSGHAWSVEAWIYPTSVRSSAGACGIVSRQATIGTNNLPFVLGYGFDASMAQGAHAGTCTFPTAAQVWIGFNVSGDGWYQCPDAVALTSADMNNWIHYIGTWDGTQLTIYRDGAQANLPGVGVPTVGFTSASSSGLASYIGKRWDATGSTPFFPGRIDEVALYNNALSNTQVSSHYAAQRVRISPTWTNISADVMSVTTTRGRTYELDAYQTGTATVVLDDAARNYDPSNNQSLYNGGDLAHPWYRILPLRPIRIRAAANDLSNPDMENTLSGTDWVALTSATLSLDTANFETGTQSLKVVTASSTGSGVRSERVPMIWPRLEAEAEVDHQITDVRTSAWIYADSGTTVRYYLQELDASLTVRATSTIQTVAAASHTWTELTLNYTLTDTSSTHVQVVFDVGSAATATFHVDAVKVAPVWPIFQGYVDAWPESYEPPDYAITSLTANDGFDCLVSTQVQTSVLDPIPSVQADVQITNLLNLSYWPLSLRYVTFSDTVDATFTIASIDATAGTDYGLTLLQDVANSELGHFFMDKRGFATFQDHNYRENLYNFFGDMGTFSDDNAALMAGTALPYTDMATSFDHQHIVNDWLVNPDSSAVPNTAGVAYSAGSIRRYMRRSNTQSTRLANASDAQAQAESLVFRTATIDKGDKVNPATYMRVETISLQPMNNRLTWRQALQREISDEIFVSRTPGGDVPGLNQGSTGISHGFFIEQISWDIEVDSPWEVTWQLSPLAASINLHPFELDISPYDNLDDENPFA